MMALRRLLIRWGWIHDPSANNPYECPACMRNTWDRGAGFMRNH